MTISPSALQAMLRAGCTAEQIVAAVSADAANEAERDAERRNKDRLRKRAERDRKYESSMKSTVASKGIPVTPRNSCDTVENDGHLPRVIAHVPADIKLSTSEENTNNKNNNKIPPKAGKARGSILPDDWVPNEATFGKAFKTWGFSRPTVLERVDAMREWSVGNGEARANWDMVLMGFLRRRAEQGAGNGSRAPPRGTAQKPTVGDLIRAAQSRQDAKANGADDAPIPSLLIAHTASHRF